MGLGDLAETKNWVSRVGLEGVWVETGGSEGPIRMRARVSMGSGIEGNRATQIALREARY